MFLLYLYKKKYMLTKIYNILSKNKYIIKKILTLFIIGFSSRLFVNNYFDINVFKDYTDIISIIYYFIFSSFIVSFDSLIEYLNFIKLFFINLKNKILNFFVVYADDGTHDKSKKRGYESNSSSSRNHRLTKKGQSIDLRSKYNTTYSSSSSKKSATSDEFKFIVDSIQEDENSPPRKLITPSPLNTRTAQNYNSNNWEVTYDGHGHYDIIERGVAAESSNTNNKIPVAPNMSNLTTPDTMSPLFPYYDDPSYYLQNITNKTASLSLNDNGYQADHSKQTETSGSRGNWNYSDDFVNSEYNSQATSFNQRVPSLTNSNLAFNFDDPDLISKRATYNSRVNLNEELQSKEIVGETDYRTVAFGRHRQDILFNTEQKTLNYNPELAMQTNEIAIPVKNNKGSFHLGIVWGEDINKIYVKYKGIAKRHFFWDIWEKDRGTYATYEEFKNNFDPKTKVFKTIIKETKSDISKEVRKLLEINNPFDTTHRINPRDIRHLGPVSQQQERLNNMTANRHRHVRDINKRKK